jgi:DNA-binding transcriptional LysR family regulator
LLHERLQMVCGAGHALARRRRLRLADLAGEAWILAHAEIAPGGPVAEAFQAAGLAPPERPLISDSLALRHSMIATGRFLTVMPHSALLLAARPHWVRVLPVTLPPLVRLFIAEAQAVVAELEAAR